NVAALSDAVTKLATQNPELQQALQSAAAMLGLGNSPAKTPSASVTSAGAGLLTYALRKVAAGQSVGPTPATAEDTTVSGAASSDAASDTSQQMNAVAEAGKWDTNELKDALEKALASQTPAAALKNAEASATSSANVLAEFVPARLLKSLPKD